MYQLMARFLGLDKELLKAVQTGDASQVTSLIEYNANVNQCDNESNTPLHWACRNGHDEVAKVLIARNANVNQCDNFNNTPLHWACFKGLDDVAMHLIDHGAKINITNVRCVVVLCCVVLCCVVLCVAFTMSVHVSVRCLIDLGGMYGVRSNAKQQYKSPKQ
jgi:ankyrin repeat protein